MFRAQGLGCRASAFPGNPKQKHDKRTLLNEEEAFSYRGIHILILIRSLVQEVLGFLGTVQVLRLDWFSESGGPVEGPPPKLWP